jgi:pimeloyl-ACP methyl ester carboxylesterase
MAAPSRPESVAPFRIHVEASVLDDLHDRLARTRWPDAPTSTAWSSGVDAHYLKELVQYWSSDFDWRASEKRLKGYPQFIADLGDVSLHYVHHVSGRPGAMPLLLIHGWPSTFAEYLPLLDELTRDPDHSFDVVLLSLPGYTFSSRPPRPVTYSTIAEWSHQLMALLGYESYGVGGDDFGAGVATFMSMQQPEKIRGMHLSHLEFRPPTGAASPALSPAEEEHQRAMRVWSTGQNGFAAIQESRPDTLSFAMTDSPAGMAAWIIDKWHAWSDHRGDLDAHVGRDFLLTTLTLFWVTKSFGTSILDYLDNSSPSAQPQPGDFVAVPTGIALFHNYGHRPLPTPPRSWAERLYNVTRWTVMDEGGHFAPVENPRALAADIRSFFANST